MHIVLVTLILLSSLSNCFANQENLVVRIENASADLIYSIPSLLEENGYYVKQHGWDENLKPSESEIGSFLSVYVKINGTWTRQVALIYLQYGKIRFIYGYGWITPYNYPLQKEISTFLEDGDKQKFLKSFSDYLKDLKIDPYSEGFIEEPLATFQKKSLDN